MRSILFVLGKYGVKTLKGFLNVSGHRNVNMMKLVVPVESETTILRTRPIMCNHILLVENGKKELGIVTADVLNTKIINNKRENEWTGAVHV